MTTVATTLAELLDLRAIEQRLIAYCNALTEQRLDEVAACFTEDADFVGMQGRAQIRAAFADHYDVPLQGVVLPLDVLRWGQYFLSNVQIDLDGDTATAVSFGRSHLFGEREGDAVLLVRGFTYSDELVRVDGEWLVRRRTHRGLWMYESTPLDDAGRPVAAAAETSPRGRS